MSCGRGSPEFKTLYDPPTIVRGGGLAHAATIHGTGSGDIRKGAFFDGTSEEDIYGMAQQILSQAYDDGTLHDSHVDSAMAVASRFVRERTFPEPVGFSRNTGEGTRTVECVFAMGSRSAATIVTIYPK